MGQAFESVLGLLNGYPILNNWLTGFELVYEVYMALIITMILIK